MIKENIVVEIDKTEKSTFIKGYDFSGKKIFLLQCRDIANTTYTPVPYGLLCICSVLNAAGVEIEVLDQNAPYADSSIESLLQNIKKQQPSFIGLRLTITSVLNAYKTIKVIKKEIGDIPIIAGGPHATLNIDEALENGVDVVVNGEGEITILNLIKALIGKNDLSSVKGIAYKDFEGKTIITEPQPKISNLDILPVSSRSYFKHDDYIRIPKDLINFASIFTSRDCPMKCTYCASPALGERYRYRSAKNVLEEIRILHEKYGIVYFNFMDDAFTVNKDRVKELCHMIKNELDFKLTFSCNSTIYHVGREILETLKDAGCVLIVYGVERIDKESQLKIRKQYKHGRVEQVIRETIEIGLDSWVNFMFGFPWERKELIDENFQFMKKYYSKINFNCTGVVVPYPGTELYDQIKDNYEGITDWWLKDESRLSILNRPFFMRSVFPDDSIIEKNFFNYSDSVKKNIRDVYWWIAWNNTFHQYTKKYGWATGWLLSKAKHSLICLSRILYYLSPSVEKNIFNILEKCIRFFIP